MSHGGHSVVHGTDSARTRPTRPAGLPTSATRAALSMLPARSTRPALLTVLALVTALLAAVLALPGTAHAAASGPMTHPELDWMGSTVRAHEGAGAPAGGGAAVPLATQTPGMDVSGYQANVDWAGAWANGGRFAYVKATEGTSYTNPYFAQQYNGSYNVGMIRGSYHFAVPDVSAGATQADYFVAHGGGWSADGKTLPGALDIEYNPYGATCYGLSAGSMVSWIASFSNEYHARTGRYPTIYSTTDWWTQCTGNSGAFTATNALWIARYTTAVGTLPGGWGFQTIWQFSDAGAFPGDQDRFNGAIDRVQAYARG